MTHEATRLAEEARILSQRLREQKVTHHQISEDHEPYRTAIKTHPVEAIKLEAANLLDALAALAQPAPTAEVALPAVSEHHGTWSVFNSGSACIIANVTFDIAADYMTADRFARGWNMVSCVIATMEQLARAQSAAKGDAP